MTAATAQEIEELNKAQEEMKMKTSVEITEMKKKTDRLVIEKAQIFSNQGQVEEAVTNSCQYIHEITIELDVVAKVKRIGEFIA